MFTDGNCSSFLNSTLLFQFTVPTILFIKKERDFFSLLIMIPYHRPASFRTYYCMLLDTEFTCLLYTSDAADEEDSVDLGGRRIIKKKKKKRQNPKPVSPPPASRAASARAHWR